VVNVNNDFANFRRFVNQLNASVFEIAALQAFDWQPLVSNARLRKKIQKLVTTANDKYIFYEIFFSFKAKNITEKYAASNEKCWNKMIQMRSSSLCSSCSGRANLFFSKNRANIYHRTCSYVIKDCWFSFKVASQYFKTLSSLGFVIRLKKISTGRSY